MNRKLDLVVALGLTGIILCFHIVRVAKAGGLWRDESAAVQLATLPSVKDVVHYFPHEAFPLLFPAIERSYAAVAGNSDLAWRLFGFLVGSGIVGALWWAVWTVRRGVPLFSLALLGFNGAFLQWGDSMRGYGLGILLLLITAGLVWRLIEHPARPVWSESSKGSRASRDWPGRRRKRPLGEVLKGLSTPFRGIPGFRTRLVAAAVLAATSVQCLFQNSILLLAICAGAMAVTIGRKLESRAPKLEPEKPGGAKPPREPLRPLDFSYLVTYTISNPPFMAILLVGLVAAISLLPYWGPLSSAREWDILVRTPVTFELLYKKLNEALTASGKWNTLVWAALFVAAVTTGIAGILGRASLPQPDPDRLAQGASERAVEVFSVTGLLVGVAGYVLFLTTLSYFTEPWYYLGLMALAALFFDLEFDAHARRRRWAGSARLVTAMVIAASSFWPTLQQAKTRQTNVDLIAAKLMAEATRDDLVVVAPWYNGISFERYYHGRAAWLTVPPIGFHKFHRYDLIKGPMTMADQEEPIRPVVDRVADTLKGGHRVWVVGMRLLPRLDQLPPPLAPAPDPKYGWLNEVYAASWAAKMIAYLQVSARHNEDVTPIPGGKVNKLEDLPLRVFEGWGGL